MLMWKPFRKHSTILIIAHLYYKDTNNAEKYLFPFPCCAAISEYHLWLPECTKNKLHRKLKSVKAKSIVFYELRLFKQ